MDGDVLGKTRRRNRRTAGGMQHPRLDCVLQWIPDSARLRLLAQVIKAHKQSGDIAAVTACFDISLHRPERM